MDLLYILGYYSTACVYFSFRWGPFVHSLGIVQLNFTRRDHPENLRRVSGSGPIICAPISHHRLKSLKHALFNVYLASFLSSVDTFTGSTEAQLVVFY